MKPTALQRFVVPLVVLVSPVAAGTEPSPTTFIGCPVYRDTDAGPKSGCWLATDPTTGIRYDVSGARTKPFLGREALVEGMTGGDSSSCGGTTLRPVHVSVLSGVCKGHMLPAEGYPGHRYQLPAEVMQPSDAPRPMPQPPFETRRFNIHFDFGSDFLRYQYSELILEDAAIYANASRARRVTVTGYAATAGFEVSGRRLTEDMALARARAEVVAESLRRLRVDPDRLEVTWRGDPEPDTAFLADADGRLIEPSRRRVEILIVP